MPSSRVSLHCRRRRPFPLSADNSFCLHLFSSLEFSRTGRIFTDRVSSSSASRAFSSSEHACASCRSVLIVSSRFTSALGTGPSSFVFPLSLCMMGRSSELMFYSQRIRHHFLFLFTWVASCASPRFSPFCELPKLFSFWRLSSCISWSLFSADPAAVSSSTFPAGERCCTGGTAGGSGTGH